MSQKTRVNAIYGEGQEKGHDFRKTADYDVKELAVPFTPDYVNRAWKQMERIHLFLDEVTDPWPSIPDLANADTRKLRDLARELWKSGRR